MKRHTLTVTVTIEPGKVLQLTNDLQTIIKNISAKDISTLAKVAGNPVMRPIALAKMREHVG